MPVVMYGIPNCDTIKKARNWLAEQGIEYRFHDYRKDGLEAAQLARWCEQLGWEAVLNKRGTTFRKLDAAVKESLDAAAAQQLMLEQPAMIKRPLLESDQGLHLGFKPEQYAEIFA